MWYAFHFNSLSKLFKICPHKSLLLSLTSNVGTAGLTNVSLIKGIVYIITNILSRGSWTMPTNIVCNVCESSNLCNGKIQMCENWNPVQSSHLVSSILWSSPFISSCYFLVRVKWNNLLFVLENVLLHRTRSLTAAINCLKLLTHVLNKNNVFYYLFIQFNWLQYFGGIGRIVSDDKLLWNIFVIITKMGTHKAKKEKFLGSVIKQVLLAHSLNVILA